MVDIPRKQDAISLLCADHAALLQLFDEVQRMPRDAAARDRCGASILKITQLLKLHLEVENTIFYPAAAVSRVSHSVEIESSFEQDDEQYVIEALEALSIDDPQYDEKVSRLLEQLKEHVLEEENEIFPRFKAANVDLQALGVKIRRRQRGLA